MIYLVTKQFKLFKNEYYKILTVEESLSMMNTWQAVQYDSETTGRDAHINSLLCIQFGNKKADCQIVVDVTTIDIQIYKNILESKPLIGQNLKFDLQFLYTNNIVPRTVYDIMIVEQLLYLGYPPKGKPGGISYALNEIAMRYLNIDIDKTVRGEIIWRGLDASVIIYAAGDVTWLEDIMILQREECRRKGCLTGAKLECDFVPVISYLEWCGIRIDESKWKAKMAINERDLLERRQVLDTLCISWNNPEFYKVERQGDLFLDFNTTPECTVNWSSSAQVIKVAKYLGFNTQIQDKKSGENKDTVIEKHLKGQKGINDEFLKVYFNYQEAAKVCSTYGQTYLNSINPVTGRIHTTFRQLGASSGRMACGSKQTNTDLAKLKSISPKDCTYVQLQNLPSDPETRAAFIPDKGNLMCSCDYSAIEARLGAEIYNEEAMLEEFLHGSGDMHSLCAKMVFKDALKDIEVKDIAKIRPDLRKSVKPVEFAKQFGGSAFSIAGTLGCSIEEAEVFSKAYDEGFKGVTAFKNMGSKFVKNNGYVLICEYTGHKMYWWDWKTWKERQESFNKPGFWDNYRLVKANNPLSDLVKEVSMHFKAGSKWERMALNAPTQGSGAIVLKAAMIDFFHYLITNNLFNIVLLCNLVHDEVVIEYPYELSYIPEILVKCMEDAASRYCFKLPIPAVPEIGDHWIH